MERQAFEPTGLVPRSIIRTFDRFRQQLLPETKAAAVQEFRISRYQVLVSVKSLLSLILVPLVINFLARTFLLNPATEYLWNTQQNEIFLNSYQEDRALREIHDFSEKVYFESLLPANEGEAVANQFQDKAVELALIYNKESMLAITNVLGDFVTFVTIASLFVWMRPQIVILKSFLTESIYSLSDTTKSFLLILVTDLLVGFHSPRGWEIGIEMLLRHFGLPENQDFIFLFVAAFPVFLDTIFKYWIFRYLNKISPSTVATYHNMIE
nr:envelope membrane protein [Coccomyxa sp. SUA001]